MRSPCAARSRMALTIRRRRQKAYGEEHDLTVIDRFGVWLSSRQIRRSVRDFSGLRVADVGCGYGATIARTLLDRVDSLLLTDIALDPALAAHPRVTAIEGWLPDALAGVADESQDVVISNSVIEHLWEPLATLEQMERILAPGGWLLLNVPSW